MPLIWQKNTSGMRHLKVMSNREKNNMLFKFLRWIDSIFDLDKAWEFIVTITLILGVLGNMILWG